MKTTLEILAELRSDAAALAGKLLSFSKRPELKPNQRRAVEETFNALRLIQNHHFCLIRRIYGDSNWQKLEPMDIPDRLDRLAEDPSQTEEALAEISQEARNLHTKILKLPGGNGCDGRQSDAIDYLMMGFGFWRIVELTLMQNQFKDINHGRMDQ